MARIVPGTLVADLSGSVGGLTAQRGAAGLVVRRIGYRRVGNHGYAELVKAVFADARRLWLGLTPVERLAWETFAGGGRSGWACFYAAVFPERVANGTMTTTVPVGSAPEALTSLSLTASVGAPMVSIAWAATPLADDVVLWVEGRVFPRVGSRTGGSGYRVFGTCDPGLGSPWELGDRWGQSQGSLVLGQSLGVRCRPWSLSSRRFGAGLEARCVVGS